MRYTLRVRRPPCARIVLVGLALGTAPGWAQAPEPSRERDLCKQNFDSYKTRLSQNPEDVQAWTEFRVCADLLRRWNDVYDVCAAALQKDPKRSEPHVLLGLAHYHAKEYPEAVKEYKEAIQLKEDVALVYFNLGLAYLFMNQPADAAAAGEKAVALDPANPAHHHQLAFAYFLLDDDEQCESAAKKAIALDPDDVAAYKILANLYTREGRQADADKAYEDAIHANGRRASANPFVADKALGPAPASAPPSAGAVAAPPASVPSASLPPTDQPTTEDPVFLCRRQWEKMRQAIARGDVGEALTYYSDYAGTRDQYRQSFTRLGPQRLQYTFSHLGALRDCEVVLGATMCKANVTNAQGAAAETVVRFERNPDHIWRIRSF